MVSRKAAGSITPPAPPVVACGACNRMAGKPHEAVPCGRNLPHERQSIIRACVAR